MVLFRHRPRIIKEGHEWILAIHTAKIQGLNGEHSESVTAIWNCTAGEGVVWKAMKMQEVGDFRSVNWNVRYVVWGRGRADLCVWTRFYRLRREISDGLLLRVQWNFAFLEVPQTFLLTEDYQLLKKEVSMECISQQSVSRERKCLLYLYFNHRRVISESGNIIAGGRVQTLCSPQKDSQIDFKAKMCTFP
jgi:hypothetical protein